MLSELDRLMAGIEFPVRQSTLDAGWRRTEVGGDAPGLRAGQVFLLVVMHVRPGREPRFEARAAEFVRATAALEGWLGSVLYRTANEPLTWVLVERFASRAVFDRHMASHYFHAFQVEQQMLLAGPVEALFLEPAG